MTYRERRLAKAARLREWAARRREKAANVFEASEQYRGDTAFNTQPGHIPERARLIAREHRAYESLEKANDMAARAAGIAHQADRAIYSDDDDALDQLAARIADLERQRDRIKQINAEIRKGAGWAARLDPPLTDAEGRDLLESQLPCPPNAPPGFPAYVLANLSGNIARQRQRLASLREATQTEQTVQP